MLLSLLFAATLTPTSYAPVPVQSAMEAQVICQQFVQVRMGTAQQPDEVNVRLVPEREGEWLVDGKVKGPEGPLLFACHLHQGERWELLNFSLWAPQPLKAV
ncbi:TPA: hypothetical protein ACSPZX_001432 [Aeromonas veronii]|uniref:hypothetical protein n=1 Tax=Aeromonas veronii TaxID=654 RepID=UPI0011176C94|nr:hypothetical protein [Aeromonas veronii]MBL0489878.1 hypothetical protein [Aeromonas veronii]TNJ14679.1 hypothetical protein CF113_15920 [Aeromonas veronii]